jgi:hypothetical protein
MTRVYEARADYYAANGFSDDAYRDRWAKVKLGPIPIWFPNTKQRRRAIPLHDLHHVATGYATSLVGEAEIAGWEIGGGCADYWAAWMLDLGAFAYGAVFAPRRLWRAFLRGRRSTPLYRTGWRNDLLDITVDELRRRVGLDAAIAPATWRDRLAFVGWIAAAFAPGAVAAGVALAALR